MCGICGIIGEDAPDRAAVHRMSRALAHRGPDDEGFYFNGRAGLGYRRLSIIDLKGGDQPICNEDGSVWIVYNGEIYNYKELRRGLEQRGHSFKTDSDTEVIVHLYEEHGERCVEHLSGMFAFAIWDEKAQKLVLARDHIGQKPLFYAEYNNTLLFASEVKGILAANGLRREVDLKSLHDYLSLRFIPAPGTMLRNISKLPPAHYLVYRNGKIEITRYWHLSFRKKLDISEADFLDGLKEKLEGTVEAHMVSDVPVGAFLSGGMDSSTIVAMMARRSPQAFKTFAIGVGKGSFNELPYARIVAEKYHTDHVEEVVEPNIMGLLPRIIWHLDEPSDPIAACVFHAARLASQDVKVVLGGDGGDELFAGFDRYLGVGYVDYYRMIPALIRRQVLGPLIGRMPESFAYKSLSQKVRWTHQLSTLSGYGSRYAQATLFFRFSHEDKRSLFGDDAWRQVQHLNSSDIIVEQFEAAEADDLVDRMLYADFMTRLPEHSLMLTDRMTMAHGLEGRSPFLDHSLVEYLATFPTSMKIRGRTLKYALRKLSAEYLPESIAKRPKQGFMLPIAYWLRNELYGPVKRLLMDSSLVNDGLFRKDEVLKLLEDHRANRLDNHVRLWMLLNLEIWHQLYIEGKDLACVEERIGSYS